MSPDRTDINLARVIPLFGRRGSRTTTDFVDDVEPAVGAPVDWVTPHDIELAPLDAKDELAALTASKPMAQLRSLLGWLGSSRPTTGTGVPRPGSVYGLAEAVGVELDGRALRARSMLEIHSLMTLWDAARAAGLIELTSTTANWTSQITGPTHMFVDPPIDGTPPSQFLQMPNCTDGSQHEHPGRDHVSQHDQDRISGHRHTYIIASSIMFVEKYIGDRCREEIQERLCAAGCQPSSSP